MAETWHIGRRTRTCAHSGARIEPGHPFYSALVERDGNFERLDFTAAAWPEVAKDAFFSYWKNKPSEGGERKIQVDFDRILTFFDGLEGSDDPGRRLFRYVLALILVRRRILRLDDTVRTAEGDCLKVYDRRGSGRNLEIVSPDATREQIAATQERLNEIFDYAFE